MTYYIFEKVPNNYLIKKIETENGVIQYLKNETNLSNFIIIEGDEYELVRKLKLKE